MAQMLLSKILVLMKILKLSILMVKLVKLVILELLKKLLRKAVVLTSVNAIVAYC